MSKQEMTLYSALDLSVGNKAVTFKDDLVIVVERLFDFRLKQYFWSHSTIRNGKGGGPMIFDASWHLGDELKKHGIEYMEDKVWIPLEWSHS